MSIDLGTFDHVHVNVSNRIEAQQWYSSIFGLYPTESLAFWAKDGGPLTLQNTSGTIHIALFQSKLIQNTTIAFRVSASGLRGAIKFLASIGVSIKPVDHEVSWSIYFKDPDGNPFEVTTYDYEAFANQPALT